MYLSVLVPLDRSSFAEQALPLALSITERAQARLDLVEVHAWYALEDPTAGWLPFEPERDTERRQQEQLYLDATRRWLTSVSPVSVSTGVLSGSTVLSETVADSILERARAGMADLIVMATHGHGPSAALGAAVWLTHSSAGPACRSCWCGRAKRPPGSSRNPFWRTSWSCSTARPWPSGYWSPPWTWPARWRPGAIEGKVVRLGTAAPEDVAVSREEVWQRLCQEKPGPPPKG